MFTRTRNFSLWLVSSLLLAACGGGGGGDGSAPAPQPAPTTVTIDIADTDVAEGDAGTTDAVFTVTLSAAAASEVTVDFATSDSTAAAGSDYGAISDTLTIGAGDTEASIVVSVFGDTNVEPDETFTVTLSNPSANATLGVAAATGTIVNDDAPPASVETGLNDTGITACSTEIGDQLSCNDPIDGTDDYPRQDAEYGRDFTAYDDGDGRAGFAFLKLDGSGALLDDQSADFATTPWDCVEDAVTGLVWMVAPDEARRDATYSWRNTSGIDDGNDAGIADGGDCPEAGSCDTEAYAAAVNAAGPCGLTSWRLPGRGELLSLVDYGAAAAPLIDAGYFPDTVANAYWTAESDVRSGVRSVHFATGESRAYARGMPISVRLVTDGGVQ